MAIVNMIGFDQMPLINGISITRIRHEGFDLLDGSQTTAMQWNTAKRDGRVRLQASLNYHGTSGNRVFRFTENLPLSTWFGNPTKLTKGVIGYRIHVNSMVANHPNAPMIFIDGVAWAPSADIISKLTPGEHYVEWVIDVAKKVLELWINGEMKASGSWTMTMASTFGIWQFFYSVPSGQPGVIMDFSDLYVVWDTEDDTPCDRLGPVQVKWLPVAETTFPDDWGYLDEPLLTYQVGGVDRAYQGLIPRYLESNVKEGSIKLTMSTTIGSGGSSLFTTANPLDTSITGFSGQQTDSKNTLGVDFVSAKKVTAYALRRPVGATYGFMDDWTFEASSDGVQWTVLDTKTSQATAHASGAIIVHSLPVDKVGTYKFYRLVSTKQVIGDGSNKFVGVQHFQLLGDPADIRINTDPTSLVNMPYNHNMVDTASPVLRTSISESEAAFRFATPVVGSADIKMVQLRLTGKRDPGTEERLIVRSEVGDVQGPEQNLRMDTDFRMGPILENLAVSHTGDAWTADTVGQLKLIVKSKTGEA